jgi:hypothetical protein
LIFITAKFQVRPEHGDSWPDITRGFTEATRAEEGCLWFEWAHSVDDPSEYVLVEAFATVRPAPRMSGRSTSARPSGRYRLTWPRPPGSSTLSCPAPSGRNWAR